MDDFRLAPRSTVHDTNNVVTDVAERELKECAGLGPNIYLAQFADTLLLFPRYRVDRCIGGARVDAAGLHLDKYEGIPADSDDVDLPRAVRPIAIEDPKATVAKKTCDLLLPPKTEPFGRCKAVSR